MAPRHGRLAPRPRGDSSVPPILAEAHQLYGAEGRFGARLLARKYPLLPRHRRAGHSSRRAVQVRQDHPLRTDPHGQLTPALCLQETTQEVDSMTLPQSGTTPS